MDELGNMLYDVKDKLSDQEFKQMYEKISAVKTTRRCFELPSGSEHHHAATWPKIKPNLLILGIIDLLIFVFWPIKWITETKKEQSEEARNVCKRKIFTIEDEIGTKIKSDHSIEYIY